MCTKNYNHMIYGSWDTKWDKQNIFSFWAIFFSFSPPTIQKMKISRLKKASGDIIILHTCAINDNHMMYFSWDTGHNRHNFLSFWTIFCPRKSKIFEQIKNTSEDIIILQMHTINHSHLIYGFWDMKCNRQNFLSFWTIFSSFTPLTTPKFIILEK